MSIYFDYNATTPLDKEVKDAVNSAMEIAWVNPSSSYSKGIVAKNLIDEARKSVSTMVNCAPHEIIFTSGGTESNNMVINTAVRYFLANKANEGSFNGKPHIISSTIEHDSVRLPLENLVKDGAIDVAFINVNKDSLVVEIDDIMSEVRPNTCLITLMLANNETGILQPAVSQLRNRLKLLNLKSVLIHTDAAQALGKIKVDVEELDVDYLTIVGHKFYGPRIGALYFKYGRPLHPMFFGGGQERNYRPGTENTPMIAGLGKAAELVNRNLSLYKSHMLLIKNYLKKKLSVIEHKVVFNVPGNIDQLPNTVSVAFDVERVSGQEILEEMKDIQASTGAACHSGNKPSSVLIASGVSEYLAARTLRLSIGRETTKQNVDDLIKSLQAALKCFSDNCD